MVLLATISIWLALKAMMLCAVDTSITMGPTAEGVEIVYFEALIEVNHTILLPASSNSFFLDLSLEPHAEPDKTSDLSLQVYGHPCVENRGRDLENMWCIKSELDNSRQMLWSPMDFNWTRIFMYLDPAMDPQSWRESVAFSQPSLNAAYHSIDGAAEALPRTSLRITAKGLRKDQTETIRFRMKLSQVYVWLSEADLQFGSTLHCMNNACSKPTTTNGIRWWIESMDLYDRSEAALLGW
ncbi:hypothetical protein BCR37DRAFT_99534 [Protomyces lactucae-debilis]|uniref:Uncharacterized protein n=1 Tax=Protomyces lactucae-debilis TaxID=2754530 RepID=A0A1Y2F532_PROLT|nr:uncharacterized protein BCR37DRAFT_99534 [Protomyces lactucae-debilis]ORY78961.1 hypothetical protein BCR37DRAFT_99534 [Protomyces lactucae-debilis]